MLAMLLLIFFSHQAARKKNHGFKICSTNTVAQKEIADRCRVSGRRWLDIYLQCWAVPADEFWSHWTETKNSKGKWALLRLHHVCRVRIHPILLGNSSSSLVLSVQPSSKMQIFLRISESFRLQKISNTIELNHSPGTAKAVTDPCPQVPHPYDF